MKQGNHSDRFHIRIDPALKERICQAAKRRGLSPAELARWVIAEWLDRKERSARK